MRCEYTPGVHVCRSWTRAACHPDIHFQQADGTILKIQEGQQHATLCAVDEPLTQQSELLGQCLPPIYSTTCSMAAPGRVDTMLCSDDFTDDDLENSVVEGSSSDHSEPFSEVAAGGTEVVYVKEGVAVCPSRSERILGRLSVVSQHHVLFLAWLPYSQGTLQDDGTFKVTPYTGRAMGGSGKDRALYAVHPIPLSDVKALRKQTPALGWHQLTLVLVNGVTLPPLYFQNGGLKGLISALKQHACLVKSSSDPSTYLVNDVADPLQRSLTCLDLSDIMIGAPPVGASTTFTPADTGSVAAVSSWNWADPPDPPGARLLPASLVDTLSKLVQGVRETTTSWFASPTDGAWLMDPLDSACGSPHQQHAETSTTTTSALSAHTVTTSTHNSNSSASAPTQPMLPCQSTSSHTPPSATASSPHSAKYSSTHSSNRTIAMLGSHSLDSASCSSSAASATAASATYLHHSSRTAADAQHTSPHRPADAPTATNCTSACTVKPATTSLSNPHAASCPDSDDFELVESPPPEEGELLSRHKVRPPPLTMYEWRAMFNADGVLVSEAAFKDRVFVSGMEPEVRREAWKFLLGVYPAQSTAHERAQLAEQQRRDYHELRQQWQSIGDRQARRFGKWRERKSRVEKDVRRTDRSVGFFAKERSQSLRALRDILLTYSMYNFDLGYCQGMSDLAAPLLYVMRDEAEAFWCFVALMDRGMDANFDSDQQGMHSQLLALRKLVQVLDPPLHAFFDRKDCLNYFFCFRWLLIHFKREFQFEEVLRLWEAFWSCRATRCLHLYMAVAVLVHHRRAILETDMDFDDLLKFCVGLSGNLDLEHMLRLAEALVRYAGEAGRECCSCVQAAVQASPE